MSVHIDSKEIANLSHLAKLHISEAEERSLAKDLTQILEYVAVLQSVKVDGIALRPETDRLPELRTDTVRPSDLPLTELLPETRLEKDLLQTPNVFTSHESRETDHN